MSVARDHSDLLRLLEPSGPFLSLPVLLRVFPQGLPVRDAELAKETRLMLSDWQDRQKDPAVHRAWCEFVIRRVLQFPVALVAEGQTIPPGMEARMAEFNEVLRPDLAILPPKDSANPQPRLLIQILPPGQQLEKPLVGKHWKASPATRMTELLHAADVPLGLVTNGEHWMLVHAPRGETSGFASWYAPLWFEEPVTFQAFTALLGVQRFFGVPEKDTLGALLTQSAADQQEVTEQLGWQVRKAVEVLVQSLDKIDQDHNRTLLAGVGEKHLYEAALTVMMRLVFLFSAEERGLLLLGEALYDEHYAVSTLREQLQEAADQHVEEILDSRFDAWSRLLATTRAVFGGVQHEAMRLPPYGGTLFNPDRFPFLEGRALGTHWRTTPAVPLKVSNRTVLHLLNALQILRVKVPGGGPAEARRLSFRALDIEQIGHVYEGLLDHTAKRATEPVLGLKGSSSAEPEVSLSRLEALKAKGLDELVEFLQEETRRSDKALKKLLADETGTDESHLLIACQHDRALLARVRPFAALLREDTLGYPVVINPGGIYVTAGSDRRSTGTHYTPRSLTEPIVQHTLEPLIYQGPAEGLPKEQWKLKTAREILALKVCDMAMGSGAFLVQTCRYLSERLVEAWEDTEKSHPGAFIKTPEGELSTGSATERLLPADPAERLAIARRYVADRCLYGVDINPMAVEMAKLSLWLITLQRDRPFTFLDHALKCGDSLLGVSTLKQVENFTLRAKEGEYVEHTFATANLFRYVEEATTKRRALEDLPSNDHTQIEAKTRLHAEAEGATAKVKTLADCLIAFELRGLNGEAYDEQRAVAADHAEVAMRKSLPEFQAHARELLRGRRTFHWAAEFPEVFAHGGFDALVGNPPFLGGSRISRTLGDDFLFYLLAAFPETSGNGDLVSFFIRRASNVSGKFGYLGFITTNSIAQGETRENGLAYLREHGGKIFHAVKSTTWPGGANVFISQFHIAKSQWAGPCVLDGRCVNGISSYLDQEEGGFEPYRLMRRLGLVYRGSTISGEGFILTAAERTALIEADSKSAEVIKPFLTGQDINQDPNQRSNRYAIDFGAMSEDQARCYRACWQKLYDSVRLQRADNKIESRVRIWWQYIGRQEELYAAIRGFPRILGCGQVSKYWGAAWLSPGHVFADKVVVFALKDSAAFGVLNSCFHTEWAEKTSSRLKDDPNYNLAKTFESFPFPEKLSDLNDLADQTHEHRHQLMLARREGLTRTYNRFHDRGEASEDIARLRALQVEMDQAVAAAYGWRDLDLGHGFHATKQGERYTISESARRTVLDRLLQLNHQRYEEEVKAGLHEKKALKAKRTKKPAPLPQTGDFVQVGLGLATPTGAERTLPAGFRFPVSDPAIYATNLMIAILSEAGGSLPWPHLRDAFILVTRPDLMKKFAGVEDAGRVEAWSRVWNEAAKPSLFLPCLRALFPRNLFIRQHGNDFIFQLADGSRPAASEDVAYDAWLGLRVSMHLNGKPLPLPESATWLDEVRELVAA